MYIKICLSNQKSISYFLISKSLGFIRIRTVDLEYNQLHRSFKRALLTKIKKMGKLKENKSVLPVPTSHDITVGQLKRVNSCIDQLDTVCTVLCAPVPEVLGLI